MNIVFIAPHGTGKGTQCDYLVKEYNYSHISTGEIIRDRIKKQDEFAKEIETKINSGILLSNEIVLKMIKDYISSNNIKGNIVFDGYPRTLEQARSLDELMNGLNQKIDIAIYLEISKEEAMKRTFGRLNCTNCKKSYNKFYEELKPKKEGICDDCGGALKGRDDDTEEAFNNLFEVFLNETYPILDYYKDKGILNVIDAKKSKEEIFNNIKSIIEGK